MKKIDLILTAAAATILAGCVDDTTVVNQGEATEIGTAIGFGFSVPNQTRANTISGPDAAAKLNNTFIVYGTKHAKAEDGTATNDQAVFQNYVVKYDQNSAGKTETNTNNWEYVGVTPYGKTVVSPAAESQTVKYWDYSATNGYTFTAFSAGWNNLHGESPNVTVEKLTADPSTEESTTKSKLNKGYKVTVKKEANLDSLFYSDRVEVAKTNYGKPVTLTFRSFGSRVRVGFYETVPGYSVKIDTFYYATSDQAVTTYKAMSDKNTKNFAAALWYVNSDAQNGNTLTVTYDSDNHPTVNNGSATYQPTLTLGEEINKATSLGESATKPTWDKSNGAFTTVYPNEACSTPMLIRCSYTLTSTDGSKEEIKVRNARAMIPANYMQWKPNYSYTYLFKISDKTNGTTGSDPSDPDNPGDKDDPEGLFPITFDATVVDVATGNEELIATMATNTVTTYAEGSDVTKNGEYKVGEEIYVVNQKTTKETDGSHAIIKPSDIGDEAGKAQVYMLSGKTSYTEGDIYAQLNGVKLGITMTALTGDGVAPSITTIKNMDAVKFKPSAVGTYAYVYTTTKYVAPVYNAVGESGSYSEGTVYYFRTANSSDEANDGVYYTASGIDANNFTTYKNQLYTKSTESDKQGTAGVYDIKVITVKASN